MQKEQEKQLEPYLNEQLIQIILSNPKVVDTKVVDTKVSDLGEKIQIAKVKIRPIQLKGKIFFQAAEYTGTKVFHKNYTKEELLEKLSLYFDQIFRQGELESRMGKLTILVSKKGQITIKEKKKKQQTELPSLSHNRKKKSLLPEDVAIPFLIDLGIIGLDGKILAGKYDKYRQINRYLEFIEDILEDLPKGKEWSIVDFGCGKSYLTFALYHYLHEVKGYEVCVIGLDLKADVIKHCSELAVRYGYEKLTFLQGDISSYQREEKVDMVVSLHACDTATDYALWKAISWKAKVIFCVPCCQKEWNHQSENNNLKNILKYGLLKERICALLTDGMRANLLECYGYRTQILEFIEMEHTPKNILIRAVKMDRAKENFELENFEACRKLKEEFHVEPTLFRLLEEYNQKERNESTL